MRIYTANESQISSIVSLRMQMLHEVAAFIPENLGNHIEQYLRANMGNGNCLCALMELDGKIIGQAMLCCYQMMPDEENVTGKYASLFSVYTLPAFRGKGYMRKLLEYLLEEAKNAGVETMIASAEEKAIPLYESLGFRLVNNEMKIYF